MVREIMLCVCWCSAWIIAFRLLHPLVTKD